VGGRSAGPEGAGGPLSGAPPGGRPADRSAAPAPSLPDFKRAASIQPELIVRPPVLVEGLLHRGCKALLSGASKAFKSWVLIDLAVSIATGRPWWGFACSPGVVIYLNFELIEPFFDHRIVSVCQAKGVPLPHDLLLWNLRAHCYDLGVLAKVLAARLADAGPVAALIVDPIYKALGDLDENSAGDMTKLMNLVETLAAPLGAAVIFGSHFSKGNPTGKEAKDRPSGSGVLIRDPDVVLVMTRHEEDDCYTIDAELRYLPRLSPFVVRWTFPLMTPDESLDPRRLYGLAREILGDDEAAGRNARPPGFTEDDMLQCLPRTGAQDVLWRKLVALRFGRAGPDYYARKAALLAAGRVRKHGLKFYPADLTLDRPIDVPPTAVHYDEEAP
jgi:hypothetical protein